MHSIGVDSGVRTGADCAKAIMLGANICGVGRPAIWGLALNGAAGVFHVFYTMNRYLQFLPSEFGRGGMKEMVGLGLKKDDETTYKTEDEYMAMKSNKFVEVQF